MTSAMFVVLALLAVANGQCPSGCQCQPSIVRCIDANWHDVTSLNEMREQPATTLQTVVIQGNSLGELAGDSLLSDRLGATVTKVDMSGNMIRSIDAVTFRYLARVQSLNLSNNELEHFSGIPANRLLFARMSLLTELFMDSAFRQDLDETVVADLVRTMFTGDNQVFNHLKKVSLENNHISKLHPETFCQLNSLVRLSLRGNELTTFATPANCAPGPSILDLSNNLITNINAGVADLWRNRLLHLNHINLSGNKLHCTCESHGLLQYLKERMEDVEDKALTICASATPARFAGRSFVDIPIDELTCDAMVEGHSAMFVISIVGLALLIAYCAYSRRDWLRKQMTHGRVRGGSAAGEFGVINGYRKLIGDDANVDPEFV